MYNEPELFSDKFRVATEEFGRESKATARRGVELALGRFDKDEGTLFGLLEIFGAAENVDDDGSKAIDCVASILLQWFPSEKAFRRPLETAEDAQVFREILENAFRRLWAIKRRGVTAIARFETMSLWANQIFEFRKDRELPPVYAPLYILALADASAGSAQRRARNELELQRGYKRFGEPFEELYWFSSPESDKLYPYNLPKLLQLGDDFVRARGGAPSRGLGPIVGTADIDFTRRRPSATAGDAPGDEAEAREYAEALVAA
jgi:hypothetical protein